MFNNKHAFPLRKRHLYALAAHTQITQAMENSDKLKTALL
jgi:predicted Rossmann fold nucleotide-binding protein DprA/Smf involved in DNA uptake